MTSETRKGANELDREVNRQPYAGHTIEPPIWQERSRPFFGLPLSFTTYTLYGDRLIVEKGFLTRRQEELRLYRVMDISLRMGLFQRLFKVGSIRLTTSETTSSKCFIHDIRNPREVTRMLSDLAESERTRVRVTFMECF